MTAKTTRSADDQKADKITGSTKRLLYPVPEARERLGGISHTHFYELVRQGKIKLAKLGDRAFVADRELERVAYEETVG